MQKTAASYEKRMLSRFRKPNERRLVRRALALANRIHARHKRDGGEPYLLHPVRAALILLDEFGIHDPKIIAAALLHDVLEMSRLSGRELERRFGRGIGQSVRLLTKPRRRSAKGWEDRYYQRIMRSERRVQLVKFADRLDNVRDLKNAPVAKQRRYIRATKKRFLPWMKAVDRKFHSKLLGAIKATERSKHT